MSTIFLHIPKTGGTTLRHLLQRQYAGQPTYTIDVVRRPERGGEHLTDTKDFLDLPPAEKKRIRLLMGHLLFGLHTELTPPVRYFTFLRRPEARVISAYYFIVNSRKHPFKADFQRSYRGLADFVADEGNAHMHNGQIRMISGVRGSEEEMLEKALANVEQWFPVVGLLERFDDSLLLMQHHFGWNTPWYKVRQKRKKSAPREKLSPALMDRLRARNMGDIAFYQAMETRLKQQLETMPRPQYLFRRSSLQLANEYHASPWKKRINKLLKTT